jgi:uncharacterized protein
MQTDSNFPQGERIAVVDVLRAFALFGIIMTHSATGFLAGRPPSPDFMTFSALDQLVNQVNWLLTFGKFFTIFSFLFGLSFALQMRNAAHKGVGFAGRFVWRLVVLGLIAAVHGLFFSGDILIIYVFLGLLLIPFRNIGTKWLVITAIVLILNVPGMVLGALQLNAPPPTPEQQQAAAQAQAQNMDGARSQFEAKQSGTVLDVFQANVGPALVGKAMFQIFTGRLWITFGLFLLGMCAGRLEIFRETEGNRRFFKRLLWVAGATALVTTVIAIVKPSSFQVRSALDLLASFSFTVQQAALSAFYVAVVTLLYWRRPKDGWLATLAPVGKMGLTVYLTQTVFGVVLFYGFGFGMLGRMGVAAAVGCSILFYAVQIVLARWWMAHFSMGPVEWLWRTLTYLKWQPNSRGALRPTGAASA